MGEGKLREAREANNPKPEREKALDMGPVREKLLDLGTYLPGAHPFEIQYGRYLATRLNPELVPQGFVMANLIALDELSRDYHVTEDQRVPGEFRSLVGQPLMVYELLRISTLKLAQATCPPDFADKVGAFLEEIKG